jgi:GNAT superfamily N-acetyltransferase
MHPADLRVCPITDPESERQFSDFPYQLYGSDPHWVAPLRSDERRRWSPRHNASLRQRWCRRFVARRGAAVVGRVAAVIDEEFARRWSPGAGFFGFFECGDDAEAARGLLAAAEGALRDEGRGRILGPVNLTTHDEVGLLVAGHDSPPMLLSPYNPPRYECFVFGAGFAPLCDYHAYDWSADRPHAPSVDRLLRRLSVPESGLVLRPSRPSRWDDETRVLFELYNASFADTWGFVPLGWDEFAQRAAAFRPFYRPELVVFAELRGRPVGFALVLPDVNEALAPLDGRLWPFGWLRLLLRLRRVRSARFLLLGVRPEATGAGVAPLLAHHAAEAARGLGIRRAELSLVHGDNRRVRHVIEAFGGKVVKTYRLYEKLIALTQPASGGRQPPARQGN